MIEAFFPQLPGTEIFQLGFVVPDRDRAMAEWSANLGAGPWFTVDSFAGDEPLYCGAPAAARVNIAMGYHGAMQIELIETCDDHPSVYRSADGELLAGFHHLGIATPQFDADWDAHIARGHLPRFTARVPGGGRVAYFDTGGALPGMIELIETTETGSALFAQIRQASEGWNGSPLVARIAI